MLCFELFYGFTTCIHRVYEVSDHMVSKRMKTNMISDKSTDYSFEFSFSSPETGYYWFSEMCIIVVVLLRFIPVPFHQLFLISNEFRVGGKPTKSGSSIRHIERQKLHKFGLRNHITSYS